jgi:hypothetical protein
MLSKLESTGIRFASHYRSSHNGAEVDVTNEHLVLGGYHAFVEDEFDVAERVMVIHRATAHDVTPPFDGIARIFPDDTIVFGEKNETDYFTEDDDWDKFKLLGDGQWFRMGGRRWAKLSLDHLFQRLDGKVFRVL